MDDVGRSLLLIYILLICCSAYCSCIECAFTAVNKIKLKSLADEGNKKAKKALAITNNFDRALTSLLISNNLVNIGAASVATLFVFRTFAKYIPNGMDAESTLNLIVTIATTVIVFLAGEMIPKSLATDRPLFITLNFAWSINLLMKILFPIAWVFQKISSLFTRIFKGKELPTVTEEELGYIIDTAEEEGELDEEQSDLLKSAMEFSDTTAGDVMTVREDIFAFDISTSNEEILSIAKTSTHSRIPIFDKSLDNIVGTLPIRAFIKEYYINPEVSVRSLLIPPFFVSESAKIDDLLSIMRQHKFYLAVVNDEDGNTVGIVTIEDFLEELVGEIWDEDDVFDADFIKLGGNKFLINSSTNTAEAFARMHCDAPDAHIAGRPIISWIIETFGRIPDEGDSFLYRNLEVIAETVDENGRVVQVEIDVLSEEDLAERQTDAEAEKNSSGGDR